MTRTNKQYWIMAAIAGAMISLPSQATAMPLTHQGANDPLNENWQHPIEGIRGYNSAPGAGISIPNDGGIPAWGIRGDSDGTTYTQPTVLDSRVGWRMSVRLRVLDGINHDSGIVEDAGLVAEVYDYFDERATRAIKHNYQMQFGMSSDGRAQVTLEDSGFFTSTSSDDNQTHNVDGDGYHWYEMLFIPGDIYIEGRRIRGEGNGTVSLYIDGVSVEHLYVGTHPSSVSRDEPDSDYVLFGNLFKDSGDANINHVSFVTGDDLEPLALTIPEPMSASVLAITSLIGLSTLRTRRPQ